MGDERLHGWETADGCTIVRDPRTGFWCYARKDENGNLVSTGVRADEAPPAGVPPPLRPGKAGKCFLSPRRYVLLGDIKPRVGWLYLVHGRLWEGPNIWMRPAIEVEKITPLLPIS